MGEGSQNYDVANHPVGRSKCWANSFTFLFAYTSFHAINNFGGFYRTEVYVHEARMDGAIIQPPCINKSYTQAVIYEKEVFIGFMFLQSFESKTGKEIIKERNKNRTFKSLDDFINRVSISIEQINILIKIDAFRFTKRNKRASD